MIKIKNITLKSSKSKMLFNDFTLEVGKGAIVGIVAPDTCGKTSLLNAIMNFKYIESGDIEIDGFSIKTNKHIDKCKYMPDKLSLYEDLTALNNVILFARLEGIEVSLKQLTDLFTEFELERFMNIPTGYYSPGMKKRLSLLITILSNPEYLLLDEPTLDTDLISKRIIWTKILDLASRGKSIIITTNSSCELIQYNKAVIIEDQELKILDTSIDAVCA